MAYPRTRVFSLEMLSTDGETKCFQVPCPNHCLIDRILLIGGDAAFSVDVYSRGPACEGADSLSGDDGIGISEDDIYKFCDTITAGTSASYSGNYVAQVTFSPWRGYENQDEIVPTRSPALQRYYIYFKITVGSPANQTFELRLSSSSDVQR